MDPISKRDAAHSKKIIRGILAFPDLQHHLEANMEFAASKDVLKHLSLTIRETGTETTIAGSADS
jgi:hypothetical protein